MNNIEGNSSPTPLVYKSICLVAEELAGSGIGKTRKNQQQNYAFRGIDEVFNVLGPLLPRYNLMILPRVIQRQVTERLTQKGQPLFFVTVEVEFDFISAEDGSRHTIKVFGEAMDSSDKATNKAMSAAYKYAVLLAFCIPTQGDNDADAITYLPSSQIFEKLSREEIIDKLKSLAKEGSENESLNNWLKTSPTNAQLEKAYQTLKNKKMGALITQEVK